MPTQESGSPLDYPLSYCHMHIAECSLVPPALFPLPFFPESMSRKKASRPAAKSSANQDILTETRV
ncbi:MAG TPA: hypothetical protein VD994_17615, partial [Prosthecobacter sp.]|nr:hypothetical protein [Prosthecobacter sp.]